MVLFPKPKLIVLDIEGTTTSISFVKDYLFPYVRQNINQFLEQNWNTEELKSDIELLREQVTQDMICGLSDVPVICDCNCEQKQIIKSIVDNVFWQMDCDRKITALKQLQGHIWKYGYQNGDIKAHIYEDVPLALKKWKKTDINICIYSSGSILAQKLLFGHSCYGDLTELIDDYFDTTIGSKIDLNSYLNISKTVNLKCEEILFLTDVIKEAQAAKSADMSVLLLLREGNAPLSEHDLNEFSSVSSFSDIQFR